MRDLRRLVWRYKAGYFLREELQGRFVEELDGMRARGVQLSRDLGDTVLRATKEGRAAREFDAAANACASSIRAARFDEALQSIRTAMDILETLEEMCLARKRIEHTEHQLLDLKQLLSNVAFVTIEDFQILIVRAREFYEGEKYRTARFIATVTGQDLARLTSANPTEEAPPEDLTARIERQRVMARALEDLCVDTADASRIRTAVVAIEGTASKRYFELALALTEDLETMNSPIETFLAQIQLYAHHNRGLESRAIQLLSAPGGDGKPDWRSAATQLLSESLVDTSRRLAQRALTAGANG